MHQISWVSENVKMCYISREGIAVIAHNNYIIDNWDLTLFSNWIVLFRSIKPLSFFAHTHLVCTDVVF